MGTTVSKLQAIVTADTQQAETNLRRVSSQFEQTGEAAKDSASLLSQVNNALDAIGLGVSFAAITGAVIGLGKQVVTLGMDAETTKVAFTTLMGGAQQADAMLGKLRDFAATTPFQFTELQSATKLMLAFGFSAEQVIPTLTSVGDAASGLGLGAEGVNRVITALGQMQAKGKVQAEEMMRFTEAGIPAWKYLAQSMGLTTAEVMKLSEKGLIPVDKAMSAILAGMDKNFGGLMETQSKTAAGGLSNLQDKMVALGTTIGTDLLPAVNSVISVLGDAVTAFDLLYNWNKRVTGAIDAQVEAVARSGKSWADVVEVAQRAKMAADGRTQAYINEAVATDKARGYTDAMAAALGVETKAQYDAGKALDIFGALLTDKQAKLTAMAAAMKDTSQGFEVLGFTSDKVASSTENTGGAVNDLGVAYTKTGDSAATYKAKLSNLSDAFAILKTAMGGAVGNEMAAYAKSTGTLTEEAAKLQEEYDKLAATQGKAYGPAKNLNEIQLKLTNAQFDAETSVIKLADAQKALNENTDPEKQRGLQGALIDAQLAAQGASGKVDEYTTAVGGASGGVVNHNTKLGELVDKLQIVKNKLEEERIAHDLRTKGILFNLLEEAIARENARKGITEYTDEQILSMQNIAVNWGLVDAATAKANTAIMAAVKEAAESHDWSKLDGKIKAINQGLVDTKTAAGNIPKTIDITVNIRTNGQLPPTSGTVIDESLNGWTDTTPTPTYSGTTYTPPTVVGKGSSANFWADGGYVGAGESGVVGERGPEWFVPTVSGTIIPNGQGNGGASTVINLTANLTGTKPATLAQEVRRMQMLHALL